MNEKNNRLKKFCDWVNGNIREPYARVAESFEPVPRKAKEKVVDEAHSPLNPTHTRHMMYLYRVVTVICCVALLFIFVAMVAQLPLFGMADTPSSNEVIERYIESGVEETGAVNLVAGIILDYRAFDTFGESAVLFLAVISVLILLKKDKNNIVPSDELELREDERMERVLSSDILRIGARVLTPIVLLFGIMVVLNGHLSPGGGFSGGAIMGAGLILYSIAFGFESIHRVLNQRTFEITTGCCLLTYCFAKGYSFFTGANHLHSIISPGTPGSILSGGLILPLNICVGLIVCCTVYGFYALFTHGEI